MAEKEESRYDTFRRLGYGDHEIYAMVLGDADRLLEITRLYVRSPQFAKGTMSFKAELHFKEITRKETGCNSRYSDVVAELKKYEQQDSIETVRKIRESVEEGFNALEKAASNRAA